MPDLLTFSDRIYVDPVMLGIFLMGLAIVTVMVMTFRHNLRQAGNGIGDFPAIFRMHRSLKYPAAPTRWKFAIVRWVTIAGAMKPPSPTRRVQ